MIQREPGTRASPDVLVVGAGAIGCSIAYYCASAGMRVQVLERDRIGSGASGAAAGMLAPQVEAHQPDAFFDFGLAGRAEHHAIAAALHDEAGIDVELRQTGVLRLALDERDATDLQGRAAWQRERGLAAEWLQPRDVADREPLFRGAAGLRLVGALWLPDECQVRSARLVWGLAAAASLRGAEVHEGAPVVGFDVEGSRIAGVRTPAGRITAGTIVVCAGAWSGHLAALCGFDLPVEPIKGQIVALRALRKQPRHILWSGECYMAPKVDGLLVVGATEERGSFDPRPTLSGMLQLATGATDIHPEFGRLPIETQWGGLRPATPDRLPVIGRVPGIDNLIVATAHFRNGVLLGPLTGKIVTALLQGQEPPRDVREYGPERFVRAR